LLLSAFCLLLSSYGGTGSARILKLIVGLGNPGSRYRGTRHNVGWEVLEHLARRHGICIEEDTGWAEVGRGEIGPHRVVLARPMTYVNASGMAVQDLKRRYRVKAEDILLIVDDLDLPLGRLRVRPKGSAGGHNGLRSVIEALGTDGFPRMRVGIGRPPEGGEAADHVLTRFTADERELLRDAIDRAAQAVEVAITDGLEVAMNRYNTKSTAESRKQGNA
jgi:PTH1 family peptidyl-tRNA hydrolase